MNDFSTILLMNVLRATVETFAGVCEHALPAAEAGVP